MKIHWLLPCLFALFCFSTANYHTTDFNKKADSIAAANEFNGIIFISKGQKSICQYSRGFSEITRGSRPDPKTCFVVGSVSKQFAAAMVLQAWESGLISLDKPIRNYLPALPMSWADTITVHHLLTHMHGIRSYEAPLVFSPGTRFDYSYNNQGFMLLALILEQVYHKDFVSISDSFFTRYHLRNTFHPKSKRGKTFLKGYSFISGKWQADSTSLAAHPAAGAFVSCASDLAKWNELLHHHKILKPATYELMITAKPGAIRMHPIFGPTQYGYGITTAQSAIGLRLGQTGYADGFASMCFYYPEKNISVVVLTNAIKYPDNLPQNFNTHKTIMELCENTQW